MHVPKIRVENGRIQIDEPTDLPNGTELYVVPAEQLEGTHANDDLDDEERAELHASIEEAERELDAGQVVSEEELWARLRAIP
ncbi:MAG TPA: hypothetical protein VJN18_17400 [Polyangiaceae bacterium]|nr:hypothetical protein [Polyangiaceae bacterium]